MKNIECQICGEIFISSSNNLSTRSLINHIKKKHNINYEEYCLKFKYNDIRPLCYCGCGNITSFRHGNYNKFYRDHKNNVIGLYRRPIKIKTNEEEIENISKILKTINMTINDMEDLYNRYINYEISLMKMEKMITLDRRTIVKYWYLLNFIKNADDFKRITNKHRFLWANSENKQKIKIDNDLLLDINIFIVNNPNKFTLNEVINKFNLIGIKKIVLYKKLTDLFGKTEIDKLLNTGNVSKPELEYFNILKYFYGNDIKQQFRLNGKIYDYILLDKILIEFDGNYWHSQPDKILNDKEKNKIAKSNGYILIRIKDTESKNFENLKKINKIYEKIKISTNKN